MVVVVLVCGIRCAHGNCADGGLPVSVAVAARQGATTTARGRGQNQGRAGKSHCNIVVVVVLVRGMRDGNQFSFVLQIYG